MPDPTPELLAREILAPLVAGAQDFADALPRVVDLLRAYGDRRAAGERGRAALAVLRRYDEARERGSYDGVAFVGSALNAVVGRRVCGDELPAPTIEIIAAACRNPEE